MTFLSTYPVTNQGNSVPLPIYGTEAVNAVFVKPSSGSDNNDGLSPDSAVKTWAQAHTVVPADRNATVYVISEDNSASGTTDYQTATLTLSKDGVRYVGVNSGGMYGQRSRISNQAAGGTISPLVTISGSNCFFSGIHVFHGGGLAGNLIAVRVTGDRNHFYRCHFAGIGSNTQDAANAASLSVQSEETLFEECVIGLDTIARGTADNSEITFDGAEGSGTAAKRVIFRNCVIPTFAEAAGHQFVKSAAGSIDRYVLFDNCLFINAIDSTATTMTEAFDINASQGGTILLRNCTLVGASDWDAGDTGPLMVDGAAPTNTSSGIAVDTLA